jgi:hypothetical protein
METSLAFLTDWEQFDLSAIFLSFSTHTGFRGGLEHLKIDPRLIDERLYLECDGRVCEDLTGHRREVES